MTSKVKAVIFGIDDVLYDASLQSSNARLSAVRAMIEAGLPIDVETGYRTLEEIVRELGPDNTQHFDKLLVKLGLKWAPEVIAAGVVAYRSTNPVYLKPYPDTVPVLLKLKGDKYKLGAVSEGKSVKQWQKLISLGVQHLFDTVVISQDMKLDWLNESVLRRALEELGAHATNAVFVGVHPEKEIDVANRAGLISVRLRKGDSKLERTGQTKPKYEISELNGLTQLLTKL